MLERIDPLTSLELRRQMDQAKLALNVRIGQQLVLTTADGQIIRVTLESKHGRGARLVVFAERSVRIATAEYQGRGASVTCEA